MEPQPLKYAYLIHLAFITTIMITIDQCTAINLNDTQIGLEYEENDTTDITLSEFKERYRRLIPYMSYYIANNNLNGQNPLNTRISSNDVEKSTRKDLAAQRRPRLEYVRLNQGRILKDSERKHYDRENESNQRRQFVPSVQYDPQNTETHGDYFIPLKYGRFIPSEIDYEDKYSPFYHAYQQDKISSIYSDITKSNSNEGKTDDYSTTVRPLRPYQISTTKHYQVPPRAQSTKPIAHANLREDYTLDYVARNAQTVGKQSTIPIKENVAINYPAQEEFESLRYITPNLHQQPVARPETQTKMEQIKVPDLGRYFSLTTTRNPNFDLYRILHGLRLSEKLPETLNNNNLDSSITTLVEILNILHNTKTADFPQISTQKIPLQQQTKSKVITESRFPTINPTQSLSFVSHHSHNNYQEPDKTVHQTDYNDRVVEYYTPLVQDIHSENKDSIAYGSIRPNAKPQELTNDNTYDITENPDNDNRDEILENDKYTLPINLEAPIDNHYNSEDIPSSSKDDVPRLNTPEMSIKYGATRGKPHIDYPAYSIIPETEFSCKEQRYKGFFGDPSTGCQVWHYCDLNGGKSSFLCPNGTIFSQVALTCDWWFNVKCESTKQLYVLNERLYKYIIPIMPKFPEDFTGPEVDRYLEIKFREMEMKLKEKKLKKQQQEKEEMKNKSQTLEGDH